MKHSCGNTHVMKWVCISIVSIKYGSWQKVADTGFIFLISLSLEPSLQFKMSLFWICAIKLSCSAGHISFLKIAAALVRAHLNFRAILESGSILLYIRTRYSALKKERLCCTIKLVCITSALFAELLTSDKLNVLVKTLFTLRVILIEYSLEIFHDFVMCISVVLFYISETHGEM